MKVGGYKGTSQPISGFAWGPMGTLYVSNVRLILKTDTGEVAQTPYDAIVTYDAHPDGLALNVNKIGVMQFKTGDQCLGAIFLKIINSQGNAPKAVGTIEHG